MKFSDGNWMLQPDVKAHYPAEAYDIETTDKGLRVHAPTQKINHRGDTLTGPLLTVEITTPLEGVLKVSIAHFTGSKTPRPTIRLEDNMCPRPEYERDDQSITIRSGDLSACLEHGNGWQLNFQGNGKPLTSSGFRGMGYIQRDTIGTFLHEQLSLSPGENIYGLGERFTAFVKNGQVVETWNKDGGTSSDQAYKAVPFYLSNRGYGVLVNDTGPVSFEIASEKVGRVQFSVPGERLEYFLIYGPTPKEVLQRLTTLTGKPALPPAWSFGLWLTTSFTTNYNEETCTRFIEGMAERKLPLHVFHFDCFWMREFNWCDFEWDPRVFPDPAGMLKRLKDRGLRISVWINPYIAQRSPLFPEAAAAGYLIKKPNGDVWQSDQWQPGMGIVDFTNPDAWKWYADKLERLAAMGVDSFKTDFGERIPTDVTYYDGSDPLRMHNHYSILYNECVFELLERLKGKGQAVLFARSSHASGQRLPVHWGGDCDSTFTSMAESLRGGLSLGLCGFGFWSHDIGGFEGLPPESLYKRWIAFGLMSSHSRLHGSSSYRVPWNYGDEACDTLRFFTHLKCRLMPYLYAKAVEAHRSGIPMMRAMLLEFPEDPASDTLDRQYMLGDALLVAPVFTETGDVSLYLPEGKWTQLLTGRIVEGGKWRKEKHDYDSMPIYVRENSLLALGSNRERPDYEYASGATLKLYQLAEDATAVCAIVDQTGEPTLEMTAQRSGDRIEIAWTGSAHDWKIELVDILATHDISGAKSESHAEGTTLTPLSGSSQIIVQL